MFPYSRRVWIPWQGGVRVVLFFPESSALRAQRRQWRWLGFSNGPNHAHLSRANKSDPDGRSRRGRLFNTSVFKAASSHSTQVSGTFLANQAEQVAQGTARSRFPGLLAANPRGEVRFRLGRRGRGRSSFVTTGRGRSGGGGCTSATGGSTTAARLATATFIAVVNFVATFFQSFFRLAADATITIGQCTGKGTDDFLAAAAGELANLLANGSCSFFTNAFVAVVQSNNQSTHDFRVADALVLAKLLDRTGTILGVASGLRLVDPVGDFVRAIVAADLLAIVATTAR